jgi:hypothetical protein
MAAEIIQFVPRPNLKRPALPESGYEQTMHSPDEFRRINIGTPTDCGNAIWPWPEKDGA